MTAMADMEPARNDPGEAAADQKAGHEPVIDRFHNRAPLAPEAVAEALGEVREVLMALETRLETVASGLSDKVDGTAAGARRLALDVVEMGEALNRRVHALERLERPAPVPEPLVTPAPAPPPAKPSRRERQKDMALTFGLAGALGAVLLGLWAWHASTPVKASAPRPPAPHPVTAAPAPVVQATPAPPPVHTPAPWHGAAGVHHGAVRHLSGQAAQSGAATPAVPVGAASGGPVLYPPSPN